MVGTAIEVLSENMLSSLGFSLGGLCEQKLRPRLVAGELQETGFGLRERAGKC